MSGHVRLRCLQLPQAPVRYQSERMSRADQMFHAGVGFDLLGNTDKGAPAV